MTTNTPDVAALIAALSASQTVALFEPPDEPGTRYLRVVWIDSESRRCTTFFPIAALEQATAAKLAVTVEEVAGLVEGAMSYGALHYDDDNPKGWKERRDRYAAEIFARLPSSVTPEGPDDAYALVREIGRMSATYDDGWSIPDDADDAQAALDGIIAKARDIMATRRNGVLKVEEGGK